MKVELIYDKDCPHVTAARTQLLSAFSVAGVSPSWIEWDREAMDSPQYVHRFGSPTILVDGQDVDPDNAASSASCCRLYPTRSGTLSGVPQVEHIASALSRGIANLSASEEANGKKG
jgi:mercuric ion transport protein